MTKHSRQLLISLFILNNPPQCKPHRQERNGHSNLITLPTTVDRHQVLLELPNHHVGLFLHPQPAPLLPNSVAGQSSRDVHDTSWGILKLLLLLSGPLDSLQCLGSKSVLPVRSVTPLIFSLQPTAVITSKHVKLANCVPQLHTMLEKLPGRILHHLHNHLLPLDHLRHLQHLQHRLLPNHLPVLFHHTSILMRMRSMMMSFSFSTTSTQHSMQSTSSTAQHAMRSGLISIALVVLPPLLLNPFKALCLQVDCRELNGSRYVTHKERRLIHRPFSLTTVS